MKTAIDSSGRVLIPKAVRARAALRPGMALEVSYADGRVVIEPAPTPVRLVRRGRFVVAVPTGSGPPLDAGVVEDVRRFIGEERSGGEGG